LSADASTRGEPEPQPLDRSPVGRLVIAGSLALIVLGWTALFHLIEREKGQAIEKAGVANASLARAYAEHVRAGLKVIDTYTWDLATNIERLGLKRVKLSASWRSLDATVPFILQISVLDAAGDMVASAPEFQRVALADREHYRVHRDSSNARLFIATPVRFRTAGKWTVPVSRRLFARDGSFAGVLVIGLDSEYFSSFYSSIAPEQRQAIAVARSDGTLLVRRQGQQVVFAQNVANAQWFKHAAAGHSGWSVVTSRIDGQRRVAAYHPLGDYPLLVTIGSPLDDALAPVNDRLTTYYAVAGAATIALLAAAFMIAFLFRREERANRDLAASRDRAQQLLRENQSVLVDLSESEARFRGLTELSSDWYWEQDDQFRLTFRSGGAQSMAGAMSPPEKGERRWQVPALNLSETDWAQHRAKLERHESFRDFEIERSGGADGTVWISLSGEPVFGPGGEFRGYRGVGRNITGRKRAERLLALEHAIARCLAADEPTETIMRTVLRTTCETQGWLCGRYFSRDEAAGTMRYTDGWGVQDPRVEGYLEASRYLVYARGEGLIGNAWETGEPLWEESPTSSSKTKYGWLMSRFNTHSAFVFPALAESEIIGVFAFTSAQPRAPDARLMQTARAIGSLVGLFLQRRRAGQDLVRLNTELEQRVSERTAELRTFVQEMEAFTYTVAHDLRSPLRAMNGYCEILIEDYGKLLPDEGRGYLRRVAANAARLGALIDDLLAFSRCSRATMTKAPVDMASLVKEIIAESLPAGNRAVVCVDALPPCVGDASLLRQVMTNLLLNAIKYSRNAPAPMIEVGHAGGAYYVRDNGVGFDMQYAGKLFGVFNRLHGTEQFEGTGVGLAIVKRVIDRHGGRVWAHSAPSGGATFYFTLG